ncbi:hypothetical protein PF010_g19293 [Phytophthora fragariae]|uniref:Uncharacterized protein n=1 Tax=Phytophthora fragariae TaxID=53985 RepID=A0A6A3E820_9STRA|nr:hypothetical protein PF003_g30532 [Phytophthora fragariae]KAE8928613.1 hypothetical protein PF009_g21250 [Phytophthora fragariae]KAE9088304.1 hypothetical protein PF007_g20025 [Phytophthora fragariae]KAE9088683.1 hypothetical protein PF010_g19293 [Phytophthora fragariae]KAE9200615.1 hypothetical protein PF004_g18956 [Phytophthora fragariae]
MSDCLFVAWTEEGSVPAGGNEVNAPVAAKTVENDSVATGTVELDTVESKEDSGYNRLFTDGELDAMEDYEPGKEASVLAGTDVTGRVWQGAGGPVVSAGRGRVAEAGHEEC